MRFSILICSVKGREALLSRLLSILEPQKTDEMEIIVNLDARKKEIGTKRNELIANAKGEYVAMVDDDDRVSPDYVVRILEALRDSPDCVGIEGVWTRNGKNPKKFINSTKYQMKAFGEDGILYRPPNHCNPIRRDLAIRKPFPEISFGEDERFAEAIYPLLKTETYVPGPIYFYEYDTRNPFRRTTILA